ncbi:saxiphilin-like [Brachyhypopomus gauderio]|uniref:saxiphilin-like n=1 Tax=Brachyhypopomus gauderio TaxID=698409 RepID=UPI00404146C9
MVVIKFVVALSILVSITAPSEHPKTKCEQERQTALDKHLLGNFIPECDEKGNYTPQQCHGSTGYCWCVDSMGQKIEGTTKPPGTSSPSCAATEHPNTKCEQERQTALDKHLTGIFIPECDEKGNYTPQQCHGSTGYCWCVDSMGQKIEGTNKPPGTSSPSCAATDAVSPPSGVSVCLLKMVLYSVVLILMVSAVITVHIKEKLAQQS